MRNKKLLKIFLPLIVAAIVGLVFFFLDMQGMIFWSACFGLEISFIIALYYLAQFLAKIWMEYRNRKNNAFSKG